MAALVQVHFLTSPVSVCTAMQYGSKHSSARQAQVRCSANTQALVGQTTCIVLAQAFDFLHDTMCRK